MLFYKMNNIIICNYKIELKQYKKDFKIQKFINKCKEFVNNMMKNLIKY